MTSIYWGGSCEVGEGPVWDSRTATLYWVDLAVGLVLSRPARHGRTARADAVPGVNCIGLTDDPHVLIAGLRDGWRLLDLRSGEHTTLASVRHASERCRFNDGAVDPAGNFWTGSLEQGNRRALGRLHRVSAGGEHLVADEGFSCANGIDWSPDGRSMYIVDSDQRAIYRYAFDSVSGIATGREGFIDTSPLDGIPDGLAVDSAGDLWCAFWDGAHVSRFSSEGRLLDRVPVPVPRPTSITFGGADLRTLYITSARRGLSHDQLRQWPDSGAVLQHAVVVPGRPASTFRPAPTRSAGRTSG